LRLVHQYAAEGWFATKSARQLITRLIARHNSRVAQACSYLYENAPERFAGILIQPAPASCTLEVQILLFCAEVPSVYYLLPLLPDKFR
jgi:hypothetical protein